MPRNYKPAKFQAEKEEAERLNQESIREIRSLDMKAWREKTIREAHARFMEEKRRTA